MIITSLLDLDLYKLTVGQVIFTYFRKVQAKYRMTVRNAEKIQYHKYVGYGWQDEVKTLERLSLTKDEANYLRRLELFTEDYVEFLSNEPMRGCYVKTEFQDKNGVLPVPQVEGDWCKVMLYEIFCLSINNELFARNYANFNDIPWSGVTLGARSRLQKKINYLKGQMKGDFNTHPLDITEFGTRRRLSKAWQDEVVRTLWAERIITGTSNVHLAMKYNIPVRGTFGHELPMGMQAMGRIQDSQKATFELWKNHWQGKLSLALEDTLGAKKFFEDFDKDLAEYYAGLRHDSGEWKEWTDERIKMYGRLGVQNKENKVLFYSDGIDPYIATSIRDYVKLNAVPKFGIGTNLTNDTFLPVPQVVMKIVECNGQPVAKISNNPAKACCDDPEYLRYIKHVSGIKDAPAK